MSGTRDTWIKTTVMFALAVPTDDLDGDTHADHVSERIREHVEWAILGRGGYQDSVIVKTWEEITEEERWK